MKQHAGERGPSDVQNFREVPPQIPDAALKVLEQDFLVLAVGPFAAAVPVGTQDDQLTLMDVLVQLCLSGDDGTFLVEEPTINFDRGEVAPVAQDMCGSWHSQKIVVGRAVFATHPLGAKSVGEDTRSLGNVCQPSAVPVSSVTTDNNCHAKTFLFHFLLPGGVLHR